MDWKPKRDVAHQRLKDFIPSAGHAYSNTRNHDDGPGRTNVSQLSPYLHAGLLSEHEVCELVLDEHSPATAEKFIAEVFWRVYFKGYLEQRPSVWASYCEERDDAFARLDSNSGLRKAYTQATAGETGIAAFDHWAQELVSTGYLHNHARMWFASIWIFTLKLDWQLGADFFVRHLIDADAASNTLSWRWVGGLHTKGKTYLARADNIARFTANHPAGPLQADGLADEAPALEDSREHGRTALKLPPKIDAAAFGEPFALLLHDEAASHVPLDLYGNPTLVIGAARPAARSPAETGVLVHAFAIPAVDEGVAAAAEAFGSSSATWCPDTRLDDLMREAGVERLAVPYLPTGWTRDALWPQLETLAADGRLIVLLPELPRATWPHAKAGFFGVKKQIDRILDELGIGGSG